MNPEQKHVFDYVLSKDKFNVFIDGVAGTGKSYLIGKIINALQCKGVKCFPLAYTAKAATNINGNTIHKMFRFNENRSMACVHRGEKGYCLIRNESDTYDLNFSYIHKQHHNIESFKIFKENSKNNCIIIDEISMVSLQILDDVNECLKRVFDSKEVFGGINYIVSGHFSQLRPVSGTAIYLLRGEMKHFIRDDTERFILSKNQRQEDTDFFNLCNSVMVSCLSSTQKKILKSRLTSNFPDIDFSQKLHIFPTKLSCDNHNKNHLIKLNSPITYFIKACDIGDKKAISAKERIFFNGLYNAIVLSNNCKVMITANNGKYINSETYFINNIEHKEEISRTDFYKGLTDTEAFPFLQLEKNLKKVIYTDAKHIKVVLSNGEILEPIERSIDSQGFTVFTRTMFPLCLSWAVTTHKIQGSTLEEAVVDMSKNNFDPVQVYVNITRLKNLEGLYISKLDLPLNRSLHIPIIKKFLKEMKTKELIIENVCKI